MTTPPKSKDQIFKDNLLIPCKSKEHLGLWFKTYLQVDLVDCVVSRFANTSPLDAAWELYSHAMNHKTRTPLNVLYVASRASQKTLLMASVEVALMLHDRRDILHYAGSKDQTEAGYKYTKDFLQKKYIREYVIGKVTADGARLSLPDILDTSADPTTVLFKLFSITPMSVQGQHAPGLFVDELLTLSFEKLKAYKDLSGIPIPMNDGRSYVRGEISSRKGAFSLVESKIASAAKTGLKVRSWTSFELMEKCPDDRSGTEEKVYYTNPFKGQAFSEEKFQILSEVEQVGFSAIKAYNKCGECPLLSICNGDAKKQQSRSKHLRSIESVVTEFQNNSLEWFLSQKMSLMPSQEGLIYSKYKKDTHIKSPKDIWEILTNTKIDHSPTITQLVEKFHEMGARSYCAVDHTGGSAPAAITVAFVDKMMRIYFVDESYEPGQDLGELISVLDRLHAKYRFSHIYPDPAAVDKNKIIKKHFTGKNVLVVDNFKKDIAAGIEAVRSKVMAASGDVSLYLLDISTEETQNEFSKYHYEESGSGDEFLPDPAEEYSHLMDAIRYLCQNIFLKSSGIVAADDTAAELKAIEDSNKPHDQVNVLIQAKLQDLIQKAIVPGKEDVKVSTESGFFWIIE